MHFPARFLLPALERDSHCNPHNFHQQINGLACRRPITIAVCLGWTHRNIDVRPTQIQLLPTNIKGAFLARATLILAFPGECLAMRRGM
jgi:hypothetical protein